MTPNPFGGGGPNTDCLVGVRGMAIREKLVRSAVFYADLIGPHTKRLDAFLLTRTFYILASKTQIWFICDGGTDDQREILSLIRINSAQQTSVQWPSNPIKLPTAIPRASNFAAPPNSGKSTMNSAC